MTQSGGQHQSGFKNKLRCDMRDQRSKLPEAVRTNLDQAIRRHLDQLIAKVQPGSIAAFWPFNGEPDITPMFEAVMQRGCELALPVVSGRNNHTMQFHAWRTDTRLVENRYGIPEPRGTSRVALADFDMLIMPLVAYDHLGNRLGMGAGYYDRHLESVREHPTPLRVGIAYSLQEVDSLQSNDWDIPLHGIVNEHGWFTFV